ncbi:MAG TPA: SDR family NAD(P)-dependent oxidoreductase [Candidatus Binatia bacterium]|jgi:meso-butanediol dehydrogenase/(S,S)-butanediol dehydrogenase/diacetyl reductase|nr:SDR family NAD(P)-dependent oxidoreductase [Candidatus Binatia bacterium]
MPWRFANRVAVVTGGASGIGAATARALAAEGAAVVVVDVDEARGAAVAREIGGESLGVDVADGPELTHAIGHVGRAHGRLDVLVTSAFAASFGSIESLGRAEWDRTIAVTLTGVFTALRAAVPFMRERGYGAVVNVASVSGLAGDRGLSAYNAAKAGVVNLTRAAALELAAAGIRVNAVCPGLVDTPALRRALARLPADEAPVRAAVPAGRFGRADEVARAICFLASDDASYVTGATLVVDGGLTAATGIPDLVPGT